MKKQRGFTIVEMLIYLGLLTVFLTVLTRIFTSTLDVQLSGEATSAIETDSRYMFLRLVYDISRASAVVTPVGSGESTSTLVLTIDGTSTTYSLSGGNLMRTDAGGTGSLNGYGSSVSDLVFTRIGPAEGKPSVKIQFVTTSLFLTAGGSESRSMETTVALR